MTLFYVQATVVPYSERAHERPLEDATCSTHFFSLLCGSQTQYLVGVRNQTRKVGVNKRGINGVRESVYDLNK